ncbi:MAG: DMT family transporter [Bacteroidales bacterium]|nr:DMT family transporter [Candidatus Cryptobacteroides faecihippi]
MNERTKTLFVLHVAVFLAGWTGIFGRWISLAGLPLVWYRVIVSVIVMTVVMGIGGKLHRMPWRSVRRIAACGFLLAMHWVAFYASIKASNVSVGVACIATSCFFTTLFDPLLNRKKVSFRDIFISLIAILGILLIFSLDVRFRAGILLGLLSAAIYSVFALLNIRVASETGEDSSTMLMFELVGGLLFLTCCMPVYARLEPGAAIVPAGSDIVSLLLLGSLFTIVPFLFQIQALRKLSAFTVNVAYNLEPVYSILLAAIIFDETSEVGLSFWIGVALVVASVALQSIEAVRARGCA